MTPAGLPRRAGRATSRALTLLVLFAASGAALADEAAAWAALRQGGVVALVRHADAPGVGDPPGWRLDDCATQRNLSERGRAEARAVGVRLRAARIPIARVLSSPWCRCVETATLLDVGAVQRESLRKGGLAIIGRWRGPGVLLVVSHGENIAALTGRSPAPAEVVVVTAVGEGAVREVGALPAPARP